MGKVDGNVVKAMSLFSNVGIAESRLGETNVEVVVANEFVPERAAFYRATYPGSTMVNGDIGDPSVQDELVRLALEKGVDLIIATPPCQGMSAASAGVRGAKARKAREEAEAAEGGGETRLPSESGDGDGEGEPEAGAAAPAPKREKSVDARNVLIKHAVKIIERVKPKFVFFENVREQLTTVIDVAEGDEAERLLTIPEYLQEKLGVNYFFNLGRLDDVSLNSARVLNSADYGVCQSRNRAIILCTKKSFVGVTASGAPACPRRVWEFPRKTLDVRTLRDTIGYLPSLDPEVDGWIRRGEKLDPLRAAAVADFFPDFEKKKAAGAEASPYHAPTAHSFQHVVWMSHTPEGMSAFSNEDPMYRPSVTKGGVRRDISGYGTTYKRQRWDRPACTVTMNNLAISSQNNVHPGRPTGRPGIWSDARAFSLYEIMLVTSIPKDWKFPEGYDEKFIRGVIGEGIPPKLMSEIMRNLPV